MKWSNEQVVKLKELCEKEMPNAEIAKEMELPVMEIYAKRSQLGITRAKVKAAKGNTEPQTSKNKDNNLICGNCKSKKLTLCIDVSGEKNERMSFTYQCEECKSKHFVCSVSANSDEGDNHE